MPVAENERPERGYTENDGRRDHYRAPGHSSLKGRLGPTRDPGKWQDRFERPEGEKEENADVPITQFEDHPEPAPTHPAITFARSIERGAQLRFAREPAYNFN